MEIFPTWIKRWCMRFVHLIEFEGHLLSQMGTGHHHSCCRDGIPSTKDNVGLEMYTVVPRVLYHWCRTWICAEHTHMPPKSSHAVQWNGKSLQTTKYFDSLGNVKLNFDISEAFLWNWTPLWIFWKCGFFILILDANKHWNIWNIHGMSTDFSRLYSVTSLGTEWVLMIHMISQNMSYIFAVSVVPWAWWNGWISLILAWLAMILYSTSTFCFLSPVWVY